MAVPLTTFPKAATLLEALCKTSQRQPEITISGFFSMALDFIKLCSPMFALLLSRRIVLTMSQAILHVLLINACKYKLACACVFLLKHVHDKKLSHNRLKVTSNKEILIRNIFSSTASLLPSTIRLIGLLFKSLSKSLLMSSPR